MPVDMAKAMIPPAEDPIILVIGTSLFSEKALYYLIALYAPT